MSLHVDELCKRHLQYNAAGLGICIDTMIKERASESLVVTKC